jgi:8-oxo-dGTP diphosphatase
MEWLFIAAAAAGILGAGGTIFQVWQSRKKRNSHPTELVRDKSAMIDQIEGEARPEIVIAIVVRSSDVLMVRRLPNSEKLNWMFPSGKLDADETPEERVIKEVQSETNVSCRVVKKLGQRLHPDTGKVCAYFHCVYLHGKERNKDSNENAEVKWVEAKRAGEYVSTDLDPEVKSLLKGVENAA